MCIWGILIAIPVEAAIIKYKTDEGQVWYVDRIEVVPEKYRDQIKGYQRAQPQAPAYNRPGPSTLLPPGSRQVEVFVKKDCVSCQLLESFLKSRKIVYVKYDIEKNPLDKQLYDTLGQSVVPVIRIGSKVIPGFSPTDILTALQK